MSNFLTAVGDLNKGKVVARNSWGPDVIVFTVEGSKFKEAFYGNYGIGGDREFPINDFLVFSDGRSVSFGWQPSTEDFNATDWVVVE